ncbi:MAG: [FeFe] hydrogenase H-cluster radical SAM maturase HydG [Deltaproteobacteria bacterium]|nr:[FeFe] hydrogenase H-cluster radical SAM maturase HydG [Deltaproteobacteria bacterium]
MIIDTERVEAILASAAAREPSEAEVGEILSRASLLKGLSLEECGTLLSIEEPELLARLYERAGEVKAALFGKRIVLFAPLYLSNYCTNNCLYCGFRKDNSEATRRVLTVAEAVAEASHLEKMGFHRLLLVSGEDSRQSTLDHLISVIEAIYRNTGIRIVHVNAAPMEVEELRRLKGAGTGVYQVFQETYHRPTYSHMHPSGKKRDYDYRLEVMERAMEAGFNDVGIGSLLGLYDYRFDTLATIAHSYHLFERYGTHAHTVSVPRLRPADGSGLIEPPALVTDEEFKKVVAVYRLALPSAGVVVSTRESREVRDAVMSIGASQMSAGSRTDPGGYSIDTGGNIPAGEVDTVEQFSTSDHRTVAEVMESILDGGFIPSVCTSCYRVGRTGREFTEKTLSGDMGKFCDANAILTLQEFLLDHGANGIREKGEVAIERALSGIKEPSLKGEVVKRISEIKGGKRDLFF